MKIHIFGASGSGVTTTGRLLAQKLNFDYFDSDDYFWELSDVPFTIRKNEEQRNSSIQLDLSKSENWILGGSIFQWNADFPDFDIAIFLWLPPQIRIERLREREFKRYGKIIYEDPDRIKQFKDFIAWASDYDTVPEAVNRNFKAHEQWLESLKCPTLRIMGDLSINERIEIIVSKLETDKMIGE
jgi:adenylate kinase family enzyme